MHMCVCHEVVHANDADKSACRHYHMEAGVCMYTAWRCSYSFWKLCPVHDRIICRGADVYCFAQDHSAQS